MNLLMPLLLVLTLVLHHCVATRVHFVDDAKDVSKRTYSEHWSLKNPVKNCTDPETTMEELNVTDTISVADCHKVLENTRYNKGYYEVWNFDSDDYAPITGFQSCVFAVSRMSVITPGGYAIIGNDDVVSAVVEAIGNQKSGNVSGVAGLWDCGTDHVTLSFIVYDGLSGYEGNRNAPTVNMHGDWAPTASESVGAPTITASVPTETPVKYGTGNFSHGHGETRRF